MEVTIKNVIKYGFNPDYIKQIVEEFYGDKIKSSFIIAMDGKLKHIAGRYRRSYTKRKVTISPFQIDIVDKLGNKEHVWRMVDLYMEVNRFSAFFHILAHELQHVIQFDMHFSIPTIMHNISQQDYSKHFNSTYYHNPKEADAEKSAQEWGPVLYERYKELIAGIK